MRQVVLTLLFFNTLAFGQMPLKQSTAVTVTLQQPFVDATDGYTRETALTVTGWACTLIKGSTASTLTITASGGSNDAAHLAQGLYSLELTATDTGTLGLLMVDVNDPNARSVTSQFIVYPEDTYDMLFSVGPADSNDVADAVQVGLTTQGYTTTRAPYLDNITTTALTVSDVNTALDTKLPADFNTVGVTSGNLHAHLKASDDNVVVDANIASYDSSVVVDANVVYWNGNAPGTLMTADLLKTNVRQVMETAIDADPNTGSIAERIKTVDDAYTATRAGYIDYLADPNYGLSNLYTIVGNMESGATTLNVNVLRWDSNDVPTSTTAGYPLVELKDGSIGAATIADNAIDAGAIAANAINDSELGADILDGVTATAPSGVPTNFREMLIMSYRRLFKKVVMTDTTLTTYADDDATAITTQALSTTSTTETMGAAQ